MVATQNGTTRMTDMDLRNRVDGIMKRRLWNAQRAATEIGCYAAQLTKWIEDPHETAFIQFRGKLIRFVQQYDAGEEPAPTTVSPEFDDLPLVDDRTAAQMDAEGEDVEGIFVEWAPPPGFALIAPAARTIPIRPAGITIAKDYGRAGISRALHAALGDPAFVFVAANPDTRRLLIVAASDGAADAQKVTKGLDLSKSIAVWAKARGIAPGFYPAEPDDERPGCWIVGF